MNRRLFRTLFRAKEDEYRYSGFISLRREVMGTCFSSTYFTHLISIKTILRAHIQQLSTCGYGDVIRESMHLGTPYTHRRPIHIVKGYYYMVFLKLPITDRYHPYHIIFSTETL